MSPRLSSALVTRLALAEGVVCVDVVHGSANKTQKQVDGRWFVSPSGQPFCPTRILYMLCLT